MLGFPAIFYIIKKKQKYFLLEDASQTPHSPQLTGEPKLSSEDTNRHYAYTNNQYHQNSSNSLLLKRLPLPSTWTHWNDIETALKLAAPCILMISFTISSYRTYKSLKMLTKIIPQIRRLPLKSRSLAAMYSSDEGAGAIREAGGAFANKERAQEAAYFNKVASEQLKKLKQHLHDDIATHEAEIKKHQEAIATKKKLIDESHQSGSK